MTSKDKCDRCFEVVDEVFKYGKKFYCWECVEQEINDDFNILDLEVIKNE